MPFEAGEPVDPEDYGSALVQGLPPSKIGKAKLDVTIYGRDASPPTCAVRAALVFNWIKFKRVEVSLSQKEIAWSDYKEIPIMVVHTGGKHYQINGLDDIFAFVFDAGGKTMNKERRAIITEQAVNGFLPAWMKLVCSDSAAVSALAKDIMADQKCCACVMEMMACNYLSSVPALVDLRSPDLKSVGEYLTGLQKIPSLFEVAAGSSRKFLGGSQPGPLDVFVFGVTHPSRVNGIAVGLQALTDAGYFEWNAAMEDAMAKLPTFKRGPRTQWHVKPAKREMGMKTTALDAGAEEHESKATGTKGAKIFKPQGSLTFVQGVSIKDGAA